MNVFSNKTCAVHYTINVISKAGADVVRTITSYMTWLGYKDFTVGNN